MQPNINRHTVKLPKLFGTFLLLCLSLSSALGQGENGDVLSLDSLKNLEQWRLIKNYETGKWLAHKGSVVLQKEVFPEVEAAYFNSIESMRMDTLDITQEMFPNLKLIRIDGLFYNQLQGVSKIKTLQYADISSLSQGDENIDWYTIYFPDAFWELKNLQVLRMSASSLSDVSERLSSFEHLKELHVRPHKSQDNYFIPWTLVVREIMTKGEIKLDFDYGTNPEYYYKMNQSTREIQGPNSAFHFEGDTLVYNWETIEMRIPMLSDHTTFHGHATVRVNGNVTEYRNYQNGLAHGKWYMKNNYCEQERYYKKGKPVGRWKIRQEIDPSKQTAIFRRNGKKTKIGHPFIPMWQAHYKDYNDMEYFKRLTRALSD